jgi:hypothetical protein
MHCLQSLSSNLFRASSAASETPVTMCSGNLQVKGVDSVASQQQARRKLMEAARRREIDVVLVLRLQPWSRSVTDLLPTVQEPEHLGDQVRTRPANDGAPWTAQKNTLPPTGSMRSWVGDLAIGNTAVPAQALSHLGGHSDRQKPRESESRSTYAVRTRRYRLRSMPPMNR